MTEYAQLTLDDIYHLSAVDADHAWEIDEQANAIAALNRRTEEGLEKLRQAGNSLNEEDWQGFGAVFKGASASVTIRTQARLIGSVDKGHLALNGQPGVFSNLAQSVRDNHLRLEALRTQRDGWLDELQHNPSSPRVREEFAAETGGWAKDHPTALKQAIHDTYDRQARQQMQFSADSYLSQVESLPAVAPYEGPRTPRAGSAESHVGVFTEEASVSGPTLASALPPPPPPGTATTIVPPTSPAGTWTPGMPPVLGPIPATSERLSLQFGPTVTTPVPHSGSTPGLGTTGSVAGDYYTPNRATTQPVIGGQIRPPTPSRLPISATERGLSRPVIGGRTTTTTNGKRASRPVFGTVRPGSPVSSNRSAPGARRLASAPRPVIRESPRPGTRATQSTPQPQVGKVIRGRTETPPPVGARFAHSPRITHGGSDELNRQVIRGSRPKSDTAEEPVMTEPASTPAINDIDWLTSFNVVPPVIGGKRPKPEPYDHGPIATAYNLGHRGHVGAETDKP
ncbi:hypothetical protein ACFQ3B_01100 [Stackebrandtia endophytica]|nr:hypothetical protein [Stackebrandtia endophytica]